MNEILKYAYENFNWHRPKIMRLYYAKPKIYRKLVHYLVKSSLKGNKIDSYNNAQLLMELPANFVNILCKVVRDKEAFSLIKFIDRALNESD